MTRPAMSPPLSRSLPRRGYPQGGPGQVSLSGLHLLLARGGLLLLTLALLAAGLLLPPVYVLAALVLVVAIAVTLRFPVAGFCLLGFSVPWGTGFAIQLGSVGVTPTDMLVAAISATWLARAAYNRQSPIVTRLWTPYIAFFLAVITLSATQSLDLNASLREIVKWAEVAAVYLAGVSLIQKEQQLRLVIAAVVTAGATQALLGLTQSAFQLGPAAFAHGAFLRAYGSFDQPNPYAGYLNMVIPLAVSMAILRHGREKLLYRVAVMLLLGALLASGSRGALLAGALALIAVSCCFSPFLRTLTWTATIAALSTAWLALLGLLPLSPFQRVLDAIGLGNVSFGHVTDANFSAVERAAHWVAGLRMFQAHPVLGVGIGNYAMRYPSFHPRGWYAPLAHAHNYYINIAAEAGVIGLVAYLVLIGSALWYSYAFMRTSKSALGSACAIGLLGALVATSVHNLFDVLYVHGMPVLLGLLMAVAVVSLRQSIDSVGMSQGGRVRVGAQ